MKQILCLSCTPWRTIPTRTQQLMIRLKDAQVLFFEPPGRRWKDPGRNMRPDLTVYTLPPVLEAEERHRLLWLYLMRETDLLKSFPRTLHIAPEVCIMRHLKPHFAGHPGQYVTADLESPLADLHFDVQQIPLADNSVEVILCNHILEHVADDRKALRELHRILKPGGWGILLSPVDRDYEQTYEDDSITDPDERTRIFGQYDHRRIYGQDYTERLREAGFEAADIDYAAAFPEEERKRFALPEDHIYVVYKH